MSHEARVMRQEVPIIPLNSYLIPLRLKGALHGKGV